MEQLAEELLELLGKTSESNEFASRLANLSSVYPFNEFEFKIAHLLANGTLSEEGYWRIRDEYLARNRYLKLFEISSPRGFGESWAQGHLQELVPELQTPSKELDSDFTGEYDFLCEQKIRSEQKIRIEVKASRAVDSGLEGPLYTRALISTSSADFWMNFQQIKPSCCDVFVFIAVWLDKIRFWVLPSKEVEKLYMAIQHRGSTGEGQLHFRQDNIADFKEFEVESTKLEEAIKAAYARQTGKKQQ